MALAQAPKLPDHYKYHAFLTHAEEDRQAAYQLCEDLEESGFKIVLADRDFINNQSTELQDAFNVSRVVLRLYSKHYDSEWEQLEQEFHHLEYERRIVKSVYILYNMKGEELPDKLKNHTYLEYKEPRMWERLCERLAADDVRIESRHRVGNIGQGLAWGYFYGYLEIVLPGIERRITDWYKDCDFHGANPKDRRISTKLFVVIPEDCYCPNMFEDIDDRIGVKGQLKDHEETRAGVQQRPYKNSVQRVTDQEGKEYFFVGEFATPVLAMYDMQKGNVAGLSPMEKRKQTVIFYRTLDHIMKHSSNEARFKDTFKLIFLKTPDDGNSNLAEKILQTLKEEIRNELRKERGRRK